MLKIGDMAFEVNYAKGKNVFPDFRPIMLVHLEE